MKKAVLLLMLAFVLLTGHGSAAVIHVSPIHGSDADSSVHFSSDNTDDMITQEMDPPGGDSTTVYLAPKAQRLQLTPLPPPKEFVKSISVHFIDVGHGDCILIKAGERSMLIDTGFPRYAKKVVEYLRKNGVSQLDYVIITHPHSDHIGGLAEIIRNFPIKNIIMPDVTYSDPSYTAALDAINQYNLAIIRPEVGMRFYLANALITILAPNQAKYDDINNYSIVTKMTFGQRSFLFTGDASSRSEAEMVANDSVLPLHADLIKIGHHGGTSSSTQAFLDLVKPEYAVISCANNEPLTFPSPVILKRLSAMGVKTYRTDQKGTIVVGCDGTRLTIK